MRVGNPIGHWCPSLDKFGSATTTDALDLSGQGNNGVLLGDAVYVNDAANGGRKALKGDGVDEYISLGFLGGTILLGDFTISLWFRQGEITGEDDVGLFGNDSNSGDWVSLSLNYAGRVQFYADDGAANRSGNSGAGKVYDDDVWHQVTFRRIVGTGYELIIDAESRQTALDNNGVELDKEVFIGRAFSGAYLGDAISNPGFIDDVRIYDRALTADEIRYISGARGIEFPSTDDGLIGRWSPTSDPASVAIDDAEVTDLTFNGHNGTLVNNATWDVADTDKSGSAAFDLDGTGDYVSVPDSDQFSIRTTEYLTVSGWIYRNGNNYDCLASKAATGQLEWILAITNNGGISFSTTNLSGPTVNVIGTNNGSVPSSQWNHIAATVDNISGDYVVYVNGVALATELGQNLVTTTGGTADLWIGASNNALYDTAGLIDDVRIYDRALFSQEVAELYRRGRPGEAVSYNKLFGQGRNNQSVGLESDLRLQETAGTVAIDRADIATDKTYVGTPSLNQLGPTALAPWLPSSVFFEEAADYVRVSSGWLDGNSNHGFMGWANNGGVNVSAVGSSAGDGAHTDINSGLVVNHMPGLTPSSVQGTENVSNQFAFIGGAYDGANLRAVTNAEQVTTPVTGTYTTTPDLDLAQFNGVNFDPALSGVALFSTAPSDLDFDEGRTGPEPIYIGQADEQPFVAPPEVGRACFIAFNSADWGIDPSFAGDNGTVNIEIDWYVDGLLVETTTNPAGYTPVGADEGKTLSANVRPFNSGGFDTFETWPSETAIVQPGGGGGPTYTVTAATGTFALTGYAADLTYSGPIGPTYTLAMDTGAFGLTGYAAILTYRQAFAVAIDTGAFALTGYAAGLTYQQGFAISAETGTFALTGNEAELTYRQTFTLTAETGTFALTGNDAGLEYILGNTLLAQTGAFQLEGSNTRLAAAKITKLDAGSFTFTGFDVELTPGRAISLDSGTFALAGYDAKLVVDRVAILQTGAFALSGYAARLVYSEDGTTAVFVCIKDGQIRTPQSTGEIRTAYSTATITC